MAKEPRQIEYPNTRKHRASYGTRYPDDLSAIASGHYDNASKMVDDMNKGLGDSGWRVVPRYGERPYFEHKKRYSYDPYKKELQSMGLFNKNEKPYAPENIDMDSLNKIYKQQRLGELANASSQFGRDLYHNSELRQNLDMPIYEKYPNLKEREGYDLREYTTEELEKELDLYNDFLASHDPDGLSSMFSSDRERYNSIWKELRRRDKEEYNK